MKLSQIEYPFKSGRFVDDNWETVITYGELRVLVEVVRAAKQVNEHWNQMGSDGDTPVFQYDLYEALSKIEFGDKDDAKIR